MEIIITQWGLDSYLNLKAKHVFNQDEYQSKIRPDIFLLKSYPNNIKFKQPKFWSTAWNEKDPIISKGFKMKWHQIGPGNIQLRLTIGLFRKAFLCEAYVKQNTTQEKRHLAKFKTYLQLIKQYRYTECGRLQ